MREDLQKLLDETSVTATDTFDFGSMVPIDVPREDYELRANAMRVLGTSKIARLLNVRSWSLEKLKTLGENAALLIIDVENNDSEKIKILLQKELSSVLVVLWNCPAILANLFESIFQTKQHFALCTENLGAKDDVCYGKCIETSLLSFSKKECDSLISNWLLVNYPHSTEEQRKISLNLSGGIIEFAERCIQSLLAKGTPIFEIDPYDPLYWDKEEVKGIFISRFNNPCEKEYWDFLVVMGLFAIKLFEANYFYSDFNQAAYTLKVIYFQERSIANRDGLAKHGSFVPAVKFTSQALGMSLACHWWKNQNIIDIADFILTLSGEEKLELWKQFLDCFELYGQYVKEHLQMLSGEATKRNSIILENQVRELIYAAKPLEAKRLGQMVETVQNHRPASLDLSSKYRSMVPSPGYAVSRASFCLHHDIRLVDKHGLAELEESPTKRMQV